MSAINFKTSQCRFGYSFSNWKEGPIEAYVRDQDEESFWTLKRDGVEVASGTASYDEEDEQNHFAICEQQATIAILLEKLKQKEAELKKKDEKLSEFMDGLPFEKAKDGKDYLLVIKSGDEIIRVAGHYRGETKVDCNPPFTLGPRWETDLNYRFYFYEEDKEETELLGIYSLPSETKDVE